MFCSVFNKPFTSQHSGTKATATTNLELQGFYLSGEFRTLGPRKVNLRYQRQPRYRAEDHALLPGRLVRQRPDLLGLRVGNQAGRPICTSGKTAKEAIPALPLLTKFSQELICREENLLADPHSFLDNLSPLLTQLQNLDIFEKPVLCYSLPPAPNLQSTRTGQNQVT